MDAKEQEDRHGTHVMGRETCCGCGLCAAKCPAKAIIMQQSPTGFWRPVIDFSACLNCGLCLKTCEALHQKGERDVSAHDSLQSECVAAWVNEREQAMRSSSGGILTALAKEVVRHGGVVSAAGFDADMVPTRLLAETEREVEAMAGSKYVQSRTRAEDFCKIKELLKAERLVLFIGTPCQVSAIKAYIGKDSPYLLTADFLCHGTPSPLLLQKYMAWRQGQYRSRMVDMGFRGKEVQGWYRSSIDCRFENGRVLHTRIDFDPFYRFFGSLLSVNNACFACRYASLTRVADITAMDYWHAPQELLRERRRLGISLVLAHTERGREIIHRLRDEGTISTRPAELAGYYRCQPAFCRAPAMPARWDDFMRDLPLADFPSLQRQYLPKYPFAYILKGMLKWNMARLVRLFRR